MANPQFTVGELRRQLANAHATWSVDPTKADADTIKLKPTGADPQKARLAVNAPATDLHALLATNSTNPFLQQRRVALQLIPAGTATMAAAPPMAPGADMGVTAGPRPTVIDWRDRFGWPWLCTVQDQDPCESCWVFAATALIETTARIEHCAWSKRSEGDVHDGMGAKCAGGGWPDGPLTWAKDNGGIADYGCWPYHTDNAPYHPSSDRLGRTVQIDDHVELGDIEKQKQWLDTVGPITGCFEVWHDFDFYHNGVYHKQSTINGQPNWYRGLHAILVIGYDDNQQTWICRNSWGAGWGGLGGYFLLGYGEVKIDDYSKFGLQGTNTDSWTKRGQHGGGLVESGNGAEHRNFELIVRGRDGRAQHWWRDGSDFKWHEATVLGGVGEVSGPCALTQTTYTRNMEFVYVDVAGGIHHRYFDYTNGQWHDGRRFGPADLRGLPGFIQSNYGAPGNFEVVVPTADGRLMHLWRENGSPWTWHNGIRFGSGIALHGVTMVQSCYGAQGNFEVIAALGDGQMQHFGRDNDHGQTWNIGPRFGAGVQSPPIMIKGQFSAANELTNGNFELCVAAGGHVQHWWRNNAGDQAWAHSATFGNNVKQVLGLIEGSFSFNLEVVLLRNDNVLQHYWRDGTGTWHDGDVIGQI